MCELFTLRDARQADLELLCSYCFEQGMDNIPDIEGVRVAVNDEDIPVGFIRIVKDSAGVAHIYPVVVYSQWQGYGVGRALVEDAMREFGELRLVSRGSSRGFYEALGFEDCDWSLIEQGVSEDCPNCSWRNECDPSPMRIFSR